MSPMKWIASKINLGHVITILTVLITGTATVVGIYYTTLNRVDNVESNDMRQRESIEEVNKRLQNLNQRVEQYKDLQSQVIEKFDARYVNQKQFDDYVGNVNRRLDKIDNNINYLIRLQIGAEK